VSREEALRLFEGPLSEHELEWEEVFGEPVEPEGEPAPGRPPMYGEKMRQTGVYLTDDQVEWLKGQPGSVSEVIRGLIDRAMDH
jgi:hypothetical protein